jgi:hypothetical protein
MNMIPKMNLAINSDKTKYALRGFEKVNEWGCEKDMTWRDITSACARFHMSEEDTLRMLCAGLLMEMYGELRAVPVSEDTSL